MRRRLPAVLLLLLSAFLVHPSPAAAHQPVIAAVAGLRADTGTHAEPYAALPHLHPARGAPDLPTGQADLPVAGHPAHAIRPVTGPARRTGTPVRRGRTPAPARAPPSTTR